MKRLVLILLFGLLALPVRAQDIVTDISHYDIELRHSFTGQELLLFGAIRGEAGARGARYDVVVVVSGEERTEKVRKKERVFGIWVNNDGIDLENVPEYYARASTRPLDEIADETLLSKLKLGLANQDFATAGVPEDYIEGLIRIKEQEGLYAISTEEMPVKSDILFRADFFFPANVPSGAYTATAYLFQGGQLIGRADQTIQIDKVGFERAVYDLATDHPRLYGLMAIIIALLAGWLAGFLTRSRSKLG